MSNILVCKFGGTSVADEHKIINTAKRLIKYKDEGYKIVVVVSAMGKSTDLLLDLASKINADPLPRDIDMLLSTGEQVSIALLSMAISSLGKQSISLTGAQCGIKTSDEHINARIGEIDATRLLKELQANKIVIVAGFQGINSQGDITTLGRGGSDTTAVALAARLNAIRCEIFTDVEGVYSADPRYVKNAKKIDTLGYDDMLELAKQGAGVIHPRSIEIARAYSIPVIIRSSLNYSMGTLIGGEMTIEKPYIRGVALQEDISRVTIIDVPDTPGIAFKLFQTLSENKISVDMIVQNQGHKLNDISFTTSIADSKLAYQITEDFAKRIGATNVLIDENVAKLSLIGTGILGYSDVASNFFQALFEMGINIQMISTSEIKISVIIDKENSKNVADKIHSVLIT